MIRREALWRIDETLKRLNFREVGPGSADYEGAIKVHGKPVDIRLSIPDVRFGTKPQITLLDRSQVTLELLAHVETGSGICYASGAGLPLDLYKPGEAILRVLAEATRTLELSFKGGARREIVDEYQSYWFPRRHIHCFLPRIAPARIAKAKMFQAANGSGNAITCLAKEPVLRGYHPTGIIGAEVWYTDGPIGPAKELDAPSTLGELKDWLDAQAGLPADKWARAFNLMACGDALFIAAPNAFVGAKIILPADLMAGVKHKSIRAQALPRLLQTRTTAIKLERLSAAWCNIEDIVNRNNNASCSLKGLSIALVGCGTIGSHLARMLVQSGAGMDGCFSLYDNQWLSEGNIGRHLLGFADIGKPKAIALKAELERFHPQVKVGAWQANALDVDAWPRIADHDLVIDATGEWNIQSALNEAFLEDANRKVKALLHAWVFMNGAGAQSFLNLRDDRACFRCLKPDFDGPWRFPAGNEKDELNLQPASCGDGAFVPFSVDASTMAASLALRAVMDWANGHSGARLRTVPVDYERGRYHKPVTPDPSPQCPACAHRRAPK
jgi:molybdopterin/thiamine biosynthesis adenylyltransferase